MTRVGSRVGPYHLTRLIGRGGMGEVYEAYDTVKDRTVALKLLPAHLSNNATFRTRLEREARSAGKLQEPHVVPIHDFGEIDGQLFVDMRLINGVDLRTVLNRDGPMPPARAVAIVRQIASALDAAHAAGVTHRDVKPENILLTADDFAYLVDFGIANAATDQTITEQGTAIGTFAYMAPERFTNAAVNYKADIYALACVLHECLTGAKPYRADSVSVLITSHLMEPAPRPSLLLPGLPPALDGVVARGMAKQPDERFTTAGELAFAAAHAAGLTDGAVVTTMPTPAPAARRRGWVIGAALSAVVVLVSAVALTWLLSEPSSAMSATQTITRTVTSTPRTAVNAPPHATVSPTLRRLLSVVPSGYVSCEPLRPPVSGALATVECGQNSNPGGPQWASYSLFQTVDALDDAFQQSTDEDTLAQCPGGADSPGTWDYDSTPGDSTPGDSTPGDSTPGDIEGSIACGDYDGTPDLTWTKNSDLMLGTAASDDMDQLHQWWIDYV